MNFASCNIRLMTPAKYNLSCKYLTSHQVCYITTLTLVTVDHIANVMRIRCIVRRAKHIINLYGLILKLLG